MASSASQRHHGQPREVAQLVLVLGNNDGSNPGERDSGAGGEATKLRRYCGGCWEVSLESVGFQEDYDITKSSPPTLPLAPFLRLSRYAKAGSTAVSASLPASSAGGFSVSRHAKTTCIQGPEFEEWYSEMLRRDEARPVSRTAGSERQHHLMMLVGQGVLAESSTVTTEGGSVLSDAAKNWPSLNGRGDPPPTLAAEAETEEKTDQLATAECGASQVMKPPQHHGHLWLRLLRPLR